MKNAPENLKLTVPAIQKDIVSAAVTETTNVIIDELGDALFAILIYMSRDITIKEQKAVVLHFIDRRGCVIECFLGIVHVNETIAVSLKAVIEALLSNHVLSVWRLHGQSYDGASNMQGEFNCLKALIIKETNLHSMFIALHFNFNWPLFPLQEITLNLPYFLTQFIIVKHCWSLSKRRDII